jgi:hypothetical protein
VDLKVTVTLTTGAVENAVSTPSVNLFVKVLNNNESQPVQAEITLYSLDGVKHIVGTVLREVAPLTADFEIFDISSVLQFEVQVSLNQMERVFVSIWGKDADANLVPAHRFVPAELSTLANSSAPTRKQKRSRTSSNSHRRRQ